MNIRLIATFIFLIVVNSGCVDESKKSIPTFSLAWTLSNGLAQPESVVYDAKHSRLYVSNVQDHPTKKDGKGYISIVSLEGKLLEKEWVNGLNAPKGMAIVGDTLYVSDIDALVAIDISKGEVVERYEVADAKFLNDVTADKDGNVYISDMFTNTIHCLCNGKFETWLHDVELMSPNGLFAEEDHLVVGSWGFPTGGFATTTAGHLKAVTYADKKITSLGEDIPVGNLDGVESDGAGGYYVTDWMAGKLFYFDADGNAQELMQLNQGAADHTYLANRNLLLIPMMKDNQLKALNTDFH
ncbi:periplasmic ATP/GTP-binding protein [Candidatus Thiomargarita nelsonii]|uniref:Periplasmic ATP/GTP-binding protein n=1 Tax=Candidatus Thiomargarita nelsonii TaxID=1003181 RepID=A0A176RUR3_9GAMM|nr:periplasmic ATP/GTP-binding protein [Candidatus Thiomargarita nelsonii]